MTTRKNSWIRWAAALLLLAAVLGITALWRWDTNKDSQVSEEAARQTVLHYYKGDILDVAEQGDGYVIQLKNKQGLYELKVDRNQAVIASIRMLERYPDSNQDPTPAPPLVEATPSPNPSPTSNPSVILTEKEASDTALKKVKGSVKEVELEDSRGKWYYFVEIETADGREATVQLHAASGSVVSVTWDDDDQSNDD
ncbi:PepSY domain-containing protein [Bacillus sp. FJAT-28004]|uniref:PepSY domain-containing protein n=1 Tax=Bacillus sp. FJAT-28004 TaxID=1679165 RepID=UPI0006B598AB|nr:PepSY domain-containing protein [Bacillus sp. FJAT-28004]